PKDMSWARDKAGNIILEPDPVTKHLRPVAVPVGGGSVERERQKAEQAAITEQKQRATYADIVTQDVDRALNIVDKSSVPVTGFGALASAVPGTPAHDLS